MKIAIIILSDPKAGDEALGRLFNALVFAHECATRNDELAVVFSGAGTRWPAELTKPGHPAAAVYNSIREHVLGVSFGCASVFGAVEDAEAAGMTSIKEYTFPGVPPVASLRGYLVEGAQTFVF